MATQHEDKKHPCRIVGCPETTQASRRDHALGATWTCAVHRRILTLSARERTQLRELSGLIQQGQLAIDAAGWLTQVPPKTPRPAIVAIDDDGFVRVRDTASPHGQTIRPEVDTLIGDDPRLDRYRIKELDDGQQ
jgi:hypothetical protein